MTVSWVKLEMFSWIVVTPFKELFSLSLSRPMCGFALRISSELRITLFVQTWLSFSPLIMVALTFSASFSFLQDSRYECFGRGSRRDSLLTEWRGSKATRHSCWKWRDHERHGNTSNRSDISPFKSGGEQSACDSSHLWGNTSVPNPSLYLCYWHDTLHKITALVY